jgi:hypothetical protein
MERLAMRLRSSAGILSARLAAVLSAAKSTFSTLTSRPASSRARSSRLWGAPAVARSTCSVSPEAFASGGRIKVGRRVAGSERMASEPSWRRPSASLRPESASAPASPSESQTTATWPAISGFRSRCCTAAKAAVRSVAQGWGSSTRIFWRASAALSMPLAAMGPPSWEGAVVSRMTGIL